MSPYVLQIPSLTFMRLKVSEASKRGRMWILVCDLLSHKKCASPRILIVFWGGGGLLVFFLLGPCRPYDIVVYAYGRFGDDAFD